jgi:hypothetical protein
MVEPIKHKPVEHPDCKTMHYHSPFTGDVFKPIQPAGTAMVEEHIGTLNNLIDDQDDELAMLLIPVRDFLVGLLECERR